MTISNGYATLAEFKLYASISSTDTNDDAVIEDLIEAASRWIDSQTHRTFYGRTETHYFDVPDGRELYFDDDLISVTTLTNGDSTVIAATEYNLIPKNKTPYYGLRLKESSSYYWYPDSSSNYEDVITIAGSWGWSATRPDNINVACLELAKAAYNRRAGEAAEGVATITGAGVVITPQGVPPFVMLIIQGYRRRQ